MISSTFRFLSIYGLPLLLGVLFIFFSLLLPNTFFQAYNIYSILSDKSVIALLALAEMVPIATSRSPTGGSVVRSAR